MEHEMSTTISQTTAETGPIFTIRTEEEQTETLWDAFGTPDKTVINWWRVGRISGSNEMTEISLVMSLVLSERGLNFPPKIVLGAQIGLAASQMTNLRDEIGGEYYVTNDHGQTISVGMFNAFGIMCPDGHDDIVITDVAAGLLGLKIGDPIIVTRKINDMGRLRFMAQKGKIPKDKLWKSGGSLGGMSWDDVSSPIISMVIEIDNDVEYWIGVSAMYLYSIYGSKSKLNHNYPPVEVESKDAKIIAKVYNKPSGGGCSIRMSSSLARDLKVTSRDVVYLTYTGPPLPQK